MTMAEGPVHVVFNVSREAHYVTRALIEWGGILPGRWVDVITTPTRPRTHAEQFEIARDLILHGNAWITAAMPEPASMRPDGVVDAWKRDDLERFAAAKAELGRQLRAVPPWSWCERLVAWLERRLERRER